MTPIGSALLQLLIGTPQDWSYSQAHDALRHAATGIIIATGSKDCVIVLYNAEVCSDALNDEDHAALYRTVAPMIDAAKVNLSANHRALLASVLNLKVPE